MLTKSDKMDSLTGTQDHIGLSNSYIFTDMHNPITVSLAFLLAESGNLIA